MLSGNNKTVLKGLLVATFLFGGYETLGFIVLNASICSISKYSVILMKPASDTMNHCIKV